MNEQDPATQLGADDSRIEHEKDLSPRQRARRAAMQAVYQHLQSDTEAGDLVLQFSRSGMLKGTDRGYFRKAVRTVLEEQDSIAALFATHLDRPPQQLDPVEHAILLLATYELKHRTEVPYRVVINEALEIARSFGAEDGHRFVNGVLDKVARETRAVEMAAARK